MNGRAVTFEWQPVDGADRYRLEVAKDTSFQAVTFEKEVPGDQTALTVTDFFPTNEQTFFWRVRARDENG